MNKLIFIIGMRRSGTSILRKLIMRHHEIENIEFEPNELLEVTERIDIQRYRTIPFFKDTLDRFYNHEKYYGAKLALNPGIEAMRWKNLILKYPDAKFIFIKRNSNSTYESWANNETSKRGICSYEMYKSWWNFINLSFMEYSTKNPFKAIILDYEHLIKDVDNEMKKVWKFLGINLDIPTMKHLIHKPRWE